MNKKRKKKKSDFNLTWTLNVLMQIFDIYAKMFDMFMMFPLMIATDRPLFG